MKKHPRPIRPRPFVADHIPVWQGSGRGYRCAKCYRHITPATKTSCKEASKVFHEAVRIGVTRHHVLQLAYIIGPMTPILFCSNCGAFTTGVHARKMHQYCLGNLSSELKNLRNNKVPGTGVAGIPIQCFGEVKPL